MGSHVDHLAKIVDDHRKVYGTRREDWELALALVYQFADTEPPVLRYQVETQEETLDYIGEPFKPDAVFQSLEDAYEHMDKVRPVSNNLNYHIRDLHTNSIV